MVAPKSIRDHTNTRTRRVSHLLAAAVNIGSGCIAGLAVAPLVMIVDKAITTNASGVEPLFPCMLRELKNLVKKPVEFVNAPACKWMLMVFVGTYITANSIALSCDISGIDPFYPKAGFTGIIYVALNLIKDDVFAKMFGKGPPKPVPSHILGMFAVRDMMTMYGSFALPAVYSHKLQQLGLSRPQADAFAQLAAPLSMPFLNTPLHLFSLDLYNNPSNASTSRASFIVKHYLHTLLARMMRTLPGFGFGGLLNSTLVREGTKLVSDLEGFSYTVPQIAYGLDRGRLGFSFLEMSKAMRQLGMFQDLKTCELLITSMF